MAPVLLFLPKYLPHWICLACHIKSISSFNSVLIRFAKNQYQTKSNEGPVFFTQNLSEQ